MGRGQRKAVMLTLTLISSLALTPTHAPKHKILTLNLNDILFAHSPPMDIRIVSTFWLLLTLLGVRGSGFRFGVQGSGSGLALSRGLGLQFKIQG